MYVELHKVQLQHFQNIVIVIGTLLIVLILIQPFYGPLSGTTQVSRCHKRTNALYGAREDNRGRHTDHPAGCHSIQTNQ